MQLKPDKNPQTGYLILEVLISIVILGLLVASVFPIVNFQLKRSKISGHDIEAASLLQEGMEVAYNVFVSAPNWETAYSGYAANLLYRPALSDNKWVLIPGEETNLNGLYKRKIQLVDICRETNGNIKENCASGDMADINSKKVITTVNWNENTGEKQLVAELLLVKLHE